MRVTISLMRISRVTLLALRRLRRRRSRLLATIDYLEQLQANREPSDFDCNSDPASGDDSPAQDQST